MHPQTPFVAYTTPLPEASVANPGHYGYNPPAPNVNTHVASLSTFTPIPFGADDGLVPGIQPLEKDINSFRTVIDYRHYLLKNRAVYIEPDADISLQKIKRKVDMIYRTLEPFSGKDPMGIIGFWSTMMEELDFQGLNEGLGTGNLCFFINGSGQNVYNNVVYHDSHHPNSLPFIHPLIVHYLLNRFIVYDLLRNAHYAVTPEWIKQSETEIDLAELLNDMVRRFRNIFSNNEFLNCFKQGLPDSTSSLLEKNLGGLSVSTVSNYTASNRTI